VPTYSGRPGACPFVKPWWRRRVLELCGKCARKSRPERGRCRWGETEVVAFVSRHAPRIGKRSAEAMRRWPWAVARSDRWNPRHARRATSHLTPRPSPPGSTPPGPQLHTLSFTPRVLFAGPARRLPSAATPAALPSLCSLAAALAASSPHAPDTTMMPRSVR
jgi:hypothetical protein